MAFLDCPSKSSASSIVLLTAISATIVRVPELGTYPNKGMVHRGKIKNLMITELKSLRRLSDLIEWGSCPQ